MQSDHALHHTSRRQYAQHVGLDRYKSILMPQTGDPLPHHVARRANRSICNRLPICATCGVKWRTIVIPAEPALLLLVFIGARSTDFMRVGPAEGSSAGRARQGTV